MREKPLLREAASFAAVGVANTAVGLGTIWLATLAGAGPYLANACGYALGLSCSYVLNRRFTFRAAPGGPGMAVRFLSTFAFAWGANLLVLTLLLPHLPEMGAQFAAMCVYTGVFFVLSKWFVFR